jgi:hypothetical protein
MAIQPNAYPLRIDKDTMAKMRVVAAVNGRSLNKEIEFCLKQVIAAYEAQHGEIRVSPAPAE